MIRRTFLFVALLTTFVTSRVGCQPSATRLTMEQRQVVLDSIASALNGMYVFPDVAARMDSDLRARAKRGEFNELSDASSFAQQLTRDLQAISHDKHLRVRLRPADPMTGPAGSRGARSSIFGRTERMAGDVAYVEILTFGVPPEEVREAITRIMSGAFLVGPPHRFAFCLIPAAVERRDWTIRMNADLLDDRVERYLRVGSVRRLIGRESRQRMTEVGRTVR